MLKRSDLKVIRGGALIKGVPDETFEGAYATNTRLMGVLVICIEWELSGLAAKAARAASGQNSRNLRQFFYIETTEEGIESYRGIYGNDEEELHYAEQSMLGGLGAARVPLTMDEAVFLVQSYAKMTKDFGKPLPDETAEYAFVLARGTALSEDHRRELFYKLCDNIDSPNQLINYFLMRYFAKDFHPAEMLGSSSLELDREQLTGSGIATLCRNEVLPPDDENTVDYCPESFVCESVIEDDRGHHIVVSEIGVGHEDGQYRVTSFAVSSSFVISSAEAAMKLARPEYVTVYEISGSADRVLYELDARHAGSLQNMCEGGKLYIVFNDDNRHMNNAVYLLNDDVKEVVFVTVENQLIIGSYTLGGIKRIENSLLLSRVAGQLIEIAKYEFKEPILYDYTMSFGGDFIRYVEEIMGFEDGDE